MKISEEDLTLVEILNAYDEIVAEDDKNIKMGLTKKCMSCHKSNCECEDTQTYWGY